MNDIYKPLPGHFFKSCRIGRSVYQLLAEGEDYYFVHEYRPEDDSCDEEVLLQKCHVTPVRVEDETGAAIAFKYRFMRLINEQSVLTSELIEDATKKASRNVYVEALKVRDEFISDAEMMVIREADRLRELFSNEPQGAIIDSQLMAAAQCYLYSARDVGSRTSEVLWPWKHIPFKPAGLYSDLAQAAAMITLEIERRLRMFSNEDMSK